MENLFTWTIISNLYARLCMETFQLKLNGSFKMKLLMTSTEETFELKRVGEVALLALMPSMEKMLEILLALQRIKQEL